MTNLTLTQELENLNRERREALEEVNINLEKLKVMKSGLDKHKSPALIELEADIYNLTVYNDGIWRPKVDLYNDLIAEKEHEIEQHRRAMEAHQGVDDE